MTMITGLDHIAIAVDDLDQAIELWQSVLAGELLHREIIESQQVEVALLRFGDLKIELVSPTSEDSPVSKYLAVRGSGIHHIALAVPSTSDELTRLDGEGIRLIDKSARTGAGGSRVGFLHPRALGGVLVELVDRGDGSHT